MARSAVSAGRIAASAANHMHQLHRIAGGNPRAVEELLIDYHRENIDSKTRSTASSSN
jgi:hypothetical protein